MGEGPEAIAEAVRRLRAGRLVAFPTETVYGLGALAFDAAAVRRVFEAKGRPPGNPLIVHVSGAGMARRVVAAWPERASRLATAFWPGPLSLVLPRGEGVPGEVTAGGGTVAVRAPDHALTLALLETLGEPLVGPSANPSGYVSPTRAEHVRAHFDDESVYVLDGGPCRAGIESTVLDVTRARAVVLRRGVIGEEVIAAALGEAVDAADAVPRDGHGPERSPGRLGPHYQPRARVVLAGSAAEIEGLLASASGPCAVLSFPGAPAAVGPAHYAISMPADAAAYAAALYAALRRADTLGAGTVIVGVPAAAGAGEAVWRAVLERLRRAAG